MIQSVGKVSGTKGRTACTCTVKHTFGHELTMLLNLAMCKKVSGKIPLPMIEFGQNKTQGKLYV